MDYKIFVPVFFFFFKKDLCICLNGSHLLHSCSVPRWRQWLILGQAISKNQWFLLGLLLRWQKPKHLCHPLLLFPSHQQGAGSEVKQPGYELAPVWDVDVTDHRFQPLPSIPGREPTWPLQYNCFLPAMNHSANSLSFFFFFYCFMIHI